MHERCGCNESVTIGVRVRYVKRRTSLGDGSVNRQDTAGECRQRVTIHPFPKDRALLFIAPLDEENSDLQLQD